MTKLNDAFVSRDWLENRLNQENLRIVDASISYRPGQEPEVSSCWEAFKQGHIPGSIYADLFDLNTVHDPSPFTLLDRSAFAEKIQTLGIGELGTTTVIYDRGAIDGAPLPSNFWASRLAWQLQSIGIDQVKILQGSFQAWQDEGRPVSTEESKYPRSDFDIQIQDNAVTAKEVQAAIDDPNTVIIDCLTPDQYAGIDTPYGDDKAGHIPSSHNLFFARFNDFESGQLLDEETIRQQMGSTGALDSGKNVITYCGFGIAATWIQYLLNALGQDHVKVYDGSLNDWHDKGLPVEK